uniref:Peptidase C1A papain C-terminal domain-containing protein n=1 Tax=Oryza punctata TaxID=4537 RepID=A0A0E0LWE0_ORYPU
MLTGDEFSTMLPDEIFEFRLGYLPVGTMASTHMVLVMGYGYRNGHPYLVFLNSNSKSFADEGFKRVYFDQIYTETMNQRLLSAMERRPNGDLEFSWKWARLNGQNILPEVHDQEMKMMRNLANRDPPALSISAHDYEEEIHLALDQNHGLGHTVRGDTTLRLFHRIGALATSSGWEGHQKGETQKLSLSKYIEH